MTRRSYKRSPPDVQPLSTPLKRCQTQSHHEQASAEDEVRQIISRVVRTLPVESLEDAVLSLATTFPVILKELRWLLRDDEASGALEVGHLEDLKEVIRIQKRFTTQWNVAFMQSINAGEPEEPEANLRESDESISSRGQGDIGRQYESSASKPVRQYGPEDSDDGPVISVEQNNDARQYRSSTSTPPPLLSEPINSIEQDDFNTPDPTSQPITILFAIETNMPRSRGKFSSHHVIVEHLPSASTSDQFFIIVAHQSSTKAHVKI